MDPAKAADVTTQEYLHLADDCLARVARWLEAFDPDEVDYSTIDGMVSLEFPDGQRFLLNRQSGNHQIWFAAGVSAWHYDWAPVRETWLDDKDGSELHQRIAAAVAGKLGRAVVAV